MGSIATDAATGRSVPRFALEVIAPIAIFVAFVHCAASTFGEYQGFDEASMLAIGGNHLDSVSADQPPLAPAFAALMDWLASCGLEAVRQTGIAAPANLVEQVPVCPASRRSNSDGVFYE